MGGDDRRCVPLFAWLKASGSFYRGLGLGGLAGATSKTMPTVSRPEAILFVRSATLADGRS